MALAASLVVGLLAFSTLPPSVRAANTDPTVYENHDFGPNPISQAANPQPYLTLQVPPGKWVAWARLQTFTTGNLRRIKCTLTANNGAAGRPSAAAGQSGYVTTVGVDEFDTIALSASIKSQDHFVTFSVRCRDETATAPTESVNAYQTRIVAMRLSSLTQTPLQASSSSGGGTGSASLVGGRSPAPAEMIHGYMTSDLPVPISSTPKTLTTLPLAAGLWSIRTSFSIVSVSGNEVGDPVNRGACRLLLNTNGGRATQTADRAFVNVLDPGHEEDREAFYLDAAGILTAPGAARLQCWQTEGQGELVVRGLRIIALKAGTLKIGDASIGSASASYGRGLPIIRYMKTQASFQIPAETETVVARIKLSEGSWYIYAKLDYEYAHLIQCHMHVAEQGESEFEGLGGQMVFHAVTDPEGPGTVTLGCMPTNGGSVPADVSYVHITAIRVIWP